MEMELGSGCAVDRIKFNPGWESNQYDQIVRINAVPQLRP